MRVRTDINAVPFTIISLCQIPVRKNRQSWHHFFLQQEKKRNIFRLTYINLDENTFPKH